MHTGLWVAGCRVQGAVEQWDTEGDKWAAGLGGRNVGPLSSVQSRGEGSQGEGAAESNEKG